MGSFLHDIDPDVDLCCNQKPVIFADLDDSTVQTDPRLKAFGYTLEQLNLIMVPMAST
ncbi:hypothetical protein INT46_004518, partial [Mucor plumbeus]